MPTYVYSCTACSQQRDETRSVEARNDVSSCPACGQPEARRYTPPIILFPRNLYTQWSDVYPNVSQREMAKDPNISRYDPSLTHKPVVEPVDIAAYLPKHGEPIEGAARRELAPVEGEGDYGRAS